MKSTWVHVWRKIHHPSPNQKKAVVNTLISDRANFIAKKIIRHKEEYYITVEEPIVREDIIILDVYKPYKRESNYVRQNLTELKKEIDESTIIIGDFNLCPL